jgi:hypothetical protein
MIGYGIVTLLIGKCAKFMYRSQIKKLINLSDISNFTPVVIGKEINGTTKSIDATTDIGYNTLFVKISGIHIKNQYVKQQIDLKNFDNPNFGLQSLIDLEHGEINEIHRFALSGPLNNVVFHYDHLIDSCYQYDKICTHQTIKTLFKLNDDPKYDLYKINYVPYIDKTLLSYNGTYPYPGDTKYLGDNKINILNHIKNEIKPLSNVGDVLEVYGFAIIGLEFVLGAGLIIIVGSKYILFG